MEERRKKKQKKVEEEERRVDLVPAGTTTTTTSSVESRRNWLELPGLPLQSVVDRLVSSPDPLDLLSFASVCKDWHAFATSMTTTSLACPFLLLPSPVFARYRRCQNPRTLTLKNLKTLESFPCKIPSETLALPCVGYSRGHLVFGPRDRDVIDCKIVLANVFSGKLYSIRTPYEFPRFFRFALITDTDLLLLTVSSLLLRHRLGPGSGWSRLDLGFSSKTMTSLAVVRDRVYGLNSLSQLIALELGGGKPKWKLIGASAPPSGLMFPAWGDKYLRRHLVECGGELLLLGLADRDTAPPPAWARRVDVYKLEPERLEWVEVDSLGDWCIFVDPMGSCPAACKEPESWGGRSNCVYVAGGPGSDGWVVLPLEADDLSDDEVEVEVEDIVGSGQYSTSAARRSLELPPWPSPLWVLPRTLLWGRSNMQSILH